MEKQQQQQEPIQLMIDARLAQELYNYIIKTPTGDVPFEKVLKLVGGLESLTPMEEKPIDHNVSEVN